MSPSTAHETKPTRARRPFFLALIYGATLVGFACGNPEPEVIARFPAVSGAPSAGVGGLLEIAGGGATGGLDSGAGVDAGSAGTAGTPFVVPPKRGRVQVVNGKLMTDLGTPLRGMLLPIDTDWDPADFEFLHTYATTTGLNAVHVYLENSSITVAGTNHWAADALVALAEQEGIYVVIGYGTGTKVGAFDAAALKAFWTYYAGRYASYSHVLYEIQNDPQTLACKTTAVLNAATLTIEKQMYTLIRSKAPDTHILMFSTTNFVYPSVLTAAVNGVSPVVDWTNASFAVGSSGTCLTPAEFPTLVDAASTAGVPLFASQLPSLDDWQPFIPPLEKAGVGWLQFRWFGLKETLAGFNKAVTAAPDVTWCPERGTFPEDSSQCHQ